MARAARKVAARPASIRRHWVDALVRDGLDPARYVELVGIVSRAVAIDTVLEALGLEVEPLPQPVAGDPSEDVDQRAGKVKAWVPMVGGASITQALSMVPAENAKLEALHGALYLSFEEMADPKPGKELTRPQMELVAARTSAYNECFY
jgi:alkylhydroperoxidase family enzyme